jgi:hypothetical protein
VFSAWQAGVSGNKTGRWSAVVGGQLPDSMQISILCVFVSHSLLRLDVKVKVVYQAWSNPNLFIVLPNSLIYGFT